MTDQRQAEGAGPVEALVLRAWGRGVRIDTDSPDMNATELLALLFEAREIDANEGRCGYRRFTAGMKGRAPRCVLPCCHKGDHVPEGPKS